MLYLQQITILRDFDPFSTSHTKDSIVTNILMLLTLTQLNGILWNLPNFVPKSDNLAKKRVRHEHFATTPREAILKSVHPTKIFLLIFILVLKYVCCMIRYCQNSLIRYDISHKDYRLQDWTMLISLYYITCEIIFQLTSQ